VNADAAIEGMSDLADGTARGFAELARLRLEPAATRAGAGTA
jgi:hypothetical protein